METAHSERRYVLRFCNYNHTVPIHKLLLNCNRNLLQCIFIFFVRKFYNLIPQQILCLFQDISLNILVASGARTTRFALGCIKKRLINITFYIRVSFKLKPSVVLLVYRLTQPRRTPSRTHQKLVEIPNAERVGVFFVFANNHRRCAKNRFAVEGHSSPFSYFSQMLFSWHCFKRKNN